jgi:glycosyltransferase A (GT-A) superfamily protein (DUF2064 family)
MSQACREATRRAQAVVLIGTDCPLVTPAAIVDALARLSGADAVLGPAEDGGYVLLALKRFDPDVFREIPWGSAQVADLTRRRMRGLGWAWEEQSRLWDVDRPEDLPRLKAYLRERAEPSKP